MCIPQQVDPDEGRLVTASRALAMAWAKLHDKILPEHSLKALVDFSRGMPTNTWTPSVRLSKAQFSGTMYFSVYFFIPQ